MISNEVDHLIQNAVKRFDFSFELGDSNFRDLISLGELIDRLAIVNFKLYMLKEKQANDVCEEFLASAAKMDVVLVEERARLKKCIDEKVLSYLTDKGNFNEEIKSYGDINEIIGG